MSIHWLGRIVNSFPHERASEESVMKSDARWLTPLALAVGLGLGAFVPQAHAQDSIGHVLIDTITGQRNYPHHGYEQGNGYRNGYGYGYGNSYNEHHHHGAQYNQNGSGYYGGNGRYYGSNGNGYYAPNNYYGNQPYGNAYGYYENGSGGYYQGYSQQQQHHEHDRHDCQEHDECEH